MRIKSILCLVLLILILSMIGVTATADYIPVKLELLVSPSVLAGPRSVDVTIKVSNIGDGDLAGNVSLFGPDGKIVTDFGDGGSTQLKQGAVYTCKTTWKVTETQLNNGKLTYSLKYPSFTDNNEPVTKSISQSFSIRRSVPEPDVVVKRSISATMAAKGQQITVTYDIENKSDVAITDIKITEHKNIASKAKSIANLESGAIGHAEFQVVMGDKDLTSEATITYKVSGNTKVFTYKAEASKILFGSPSITAKLEPAAASAIINNTLKLKLTLTNTGNMDYQNIRISDPILGEVFTNQQVAAQQKLELEKEITVRETHSYTFTIEAADSSGKMVTLSSNKITVTAVDPSKQLELKVTATASSNKIYSQPGVVTFKVEVMNPSEVDAKDVKIICGKTLVHTFGEIKSGDTLSFSRPVSATQAGRFQFAASTKDQLNNTVEFLSDVILISYERPTPVPTTAPPEPDPILNILPTPTEVEIPEYMLRLQSITQTVGLLFTVLTGIALILVVFVLIKRLAAKRKSAQAYDHLERAERRDYAQEHSPREQRP